MPRLTPEELETFLDEPGHLLRVASVDDDGMPRLVPVWFVRLADIGNDRDANGPGIGPPSPLGTILFTPRSRSILLSNLRRDPRLALSIDEDALPYRKLSVQGVGRIEHDVGHDDEWRDVYRAIATRYLDETTADRYLGATHDQPRALVAVDLDRSRTTTWRMPVDDEPATGIWAGRYLAPGSRLDRQRTDDT